ncbi:MAG: class I SAM-dependent methyltransferase [Prolixibacteraceae bacterium]|nr:class I SAM-dependent methyltransferase [Prolixibacteraceae bacterium]
MNKSEKFWDRSVNMWNRQANSYSHIKSIENIKQYLNDSDIVLDYGCATGTVAIKVADKVKVIYGIDISSKMINTALKNASELNIENINFAKSTLFDDRYRIESFDVIIAFHILHYLKDTHKEIIRINELLKPGGLIISATFCMGEKKNYRGVLLFFIVFLLTKLGILPYMRLFKFSELEKLITNCNFQIVETKCLDPKSTNYFIVAKKI